MPNLGGRGGGQPDRAHNDFMFYGYVTSVN